MCKGRVKRFEVDLKREVADNADKLTLLISVGLLKREAEVVEKDNETLQCECLGSPAD